MVFHFRVRVCVCVCDFVIALVCLVWVCCLQVCLFGRCVFVFGGVGSVGWVGRVGRSVFFFGGVLGLVDGAPLVLPVRLCLRLSVGFVSQPLARAAARSVGRLVCLSVCLAVGLWVCSFFVYFCFPSRLFVCFFLIFSVTMPALQPPGGNQVDGLPPAQRHPKPEFL